MFTQIASRNSLASYSSASGVKCARAAKSPSSLAVLSLLLFTGLLAGTACGQTALGNGRGLEADLSGRGIGNVPRPDFMAEVRMRNDLVTGNAVGGRSFRGNVGYRSGDEFRGSLGSDANFSFRRDSISSGIGGVGLRGTSSLQYQYSMSTSNQFGTAPSLSTLGGQIEQNKTDFNLRSSSPRRITSGEYTTIGDGWNNLAPRLGTLRSTSTFNSISSLNPAVIGSRETPQGVESLTASSLLGLRSVPQRRLQGDGELPPGAVNQAAAPTRVNTAVGGAVPNEATPPGTETGNIRTAYTQVTDRFRKASGNAARPSQPVENQAGDAPATEKTAPEALDWETRIAKLREQLEITSREREERLARASLRARVLDPEKVDAKARPKDGLISKDKAVTKKDPKAAGEAAGIAFIDFDPATLEMIRAAAGEVDAYTLSSAEKDLYSRYMTQGSAAMASGKYFDAEEQFARCLAVAPGDPMASAARLNSQLGGALFLSAALNLEALLGKHPELATTRYTGGTMPSAKRLGDIAIVLRERISKDTQLGAAPPRDASLLLAYTGYQLKDVGIMQEGLTALSASNAASGHDDALHKLLKAVWAP